MTMLPFRNIKVPSPGFGVYSLSGGYGPADDEDSMKVLRLAYDLGSRFWDTASVYGFGHNERLIGRFIKENPEVRKDLFIASKCAWEFDAAKQIRIKVTNSREHIIRTLKESTERLGTAPDLYYLHRRDPHTPLQESISTLDELRKEGKIRYFGISECSAKTLREACSIAQVDAIQVEYSAFCLDPEKNGVLETAKELGVTVVAWSPLGTGILTGQFTKEEDFKNPLHLKSGTRFQGDSLEKNLKMVEESKEIAKKKGCTPAQLAIAWCVSQGTIPIPGTKRPEKLKENWDARNVVLTDEEVRDIREVIKDGAVGTRWNENVTRLMNH